LPEQVVTGLNRIKPGMPYREQDLEDLQNRLQRSGYFNSVFVSIAADPENADAVPVRVSVTENLERTLGFGVGYSTDLGFGVELRYEDNLTFRPGWRSNTSLKIEQKEQSARTRLQLVPLARGFQPVVSAEVKRSDIQNDETLTTRVIGQLVNVSGTRELSLSLDFNYEWQRVEGESRDDITAVPLNLSWTRRELDDLLFPRSGYIINLQAGGALDWLLSNTSFFRLYGRGNYYYPVGTRSKLLLRGEVGAVESDSRDDIPTDYLFRTGGSQSVRGYEFGSLGVIDGDAIVPGRYIAVASAEFMFPVSGDWFGAVFVDAGNAVDRIEDYEAKLGYGAGVRWMSPLGPLNLDVAYGEADSTWRLHFSISSVF
jgi:translocation and assembly module TamA